MPEVTSYKIGVSRGVRGGAVRWITLHLEPPESGVKEVSLFFHEGRVPDLGFINEESGFVNVNLPVGDFDALYKVINQERPIFVNWRTDPEERRLASIDVSTTDEPVGEGTTDRSPP